ncbi:MAG: CinA family nicotinamide mononucleotide deamidase-related protein [Flavobacteriia bacterium]
MNVEVLAIGDELLIGQTINTNASWIGQEMSLRGYRVLRSSTIQDEPNAIVGALDNILPNTNCVIITGGLGPTKDDLTKYTLASYFDSPLEIHQPTLTQIEAFFASRNRPMLEVNVQQAALPTKAQILKNRQGTAAGMWFEKNNVIFISLPGVPYEMKTIMSEEAFPLLELRFAGLTLYHKTMHTQGIGESFLADQIADWEERVRNLGLGLAYLPSPGLVKLRLSSYTGKENEALIDQLFEELEKRLPEYIFGYDNCTIEAALGQELLAKNASIGTVESCTAGLLAQHIASISGASTYYQGALLTYSNKLKVKIAKVDPAVIEKHGAVSEEVAKEMAENGRALLGVDYCLSTTGVAGPTGGSPKKPVGLVWVGLSGPHGTIAKKFQFGDNRQRNLEMTVLGAMNWLRFYLKSN